MSRRELKCKPLVEAILELKWELPDQRAQKIEADPHYRLLLGRFSTEMEGAYPIHESLPTSQIPDVMALHMAQHRFRSREGGWPLLQLGPGLMTVNETEGYRWDDFKQRCNRAVSGLVSAHPAREEFRIQELTLRYIDAVDVDFGKESVLNFLQDKMKTNISLPDSLFASGRVQENPLAFNWQVSFPADDPGGTITLRFATGKHNNRQALVWETLVQAAREQIPVIPDGFTTWLDKAHELTGDWFFKLIEGELEGRFSGE